MASAFFFALLARSAALAAWHHDHGGAQALIIQFQT